MKALKFSEEMIFAVWRCTAVSLLLGQIDFDEKSFADAESGKLGVIKNMDLIEKIAKLLGIKDIDFFKRILLEGRSIAGKDVIWKANTLKKAIDNKDALSKQLFNNLFDWLVIVMNKTIEPPDINEPGFLDRAKTIGLLDIFGFENFA